MDHIMTNANDLQGDFSKSSLPSLLQYLGMIGATGELVLSIPPVDKAVISLERGKLVDARYREHTGQQALFQVMQTSNGFFQFKTGIVDVKSSIDSSLEHLLMGAAAFEHARTQFQPNDIPSIIPSSTSGNINLQAAQLRVVAMIDGSRSISQLATSVRGSVGDVTALISQLVESGLVAVKTKTVQAVNPQFFEDLRPRISSLVGPMAQIMMVDAAERLGHNLENLDKRLVRAFLTELHKEIPSNQMKQFVVLVQPLLRQYENQ
jgi:Domain of unknown function (DUF4388)